MNPSQEISYQTYQNYIKPDWAPPSYLFGPVWSVLYLIIFITFGFVFLKFLKKRIQFGILLPFALNIFFNLIFTPIQFGLQNNWLASVDIVLVWATLVWAMLVVYKKYRWVALAQIPYLLWVSFATVLQFTITYLNW
jgi:tryptophan-rich sensory protein